MTAFDGLREHYEPLAITAPRRRVPRWRRVWPLYGPALLIAAGAGMILGSWLVLIVMEVLG